MSQAWDKERIWSSPRQNSKYDLPIQTPGGRSIHLSYGALKKSEAIY